MERRVALALVSLVLLASACTGQAAPSGAPSSGGEGTDDPIRIGAILPLTGAGSAYGPGMEVVIRAAVDEVNSAGGVLGREVELFVEDDATNPDQAVRAANKLIDVNQVDAIVGTWASAVSLAVAPRTIEANIIGMNVSGAPEISDLDDNGTVFRANASDFQLGTAVGTQLYADGFQTMTILTNNASGAVGFAETVRDAFTEAGGEVLEYIEYAEGQQSYSTEVNRALETEPDIYFLSCYTPDGAQIFEAAYEGGASGSQFGVNGWCMNTQLADAVGAEVVEGAMAFDVVAAADTAAFERLASVYEEETGESLADNVYAVHAYDSIALLALAIQLAGSTDGEAVGAAMIDISNAPGEKVDNFADGLALLESGEEIDYDGASGPVDFNEAGDMTPFAGMFEMQDGKPVFVKSFGGE